VNPGGRIKGTRVGGYEIVRVLGHGTMASVFEGAHVLLGKPVAIKVLHEHLASDPGVRERFLREGRIAARLRHPNIVDVVDVGAEGTTPYMVMDLLAGDDLRALLAGGGALTPTHALALLLPIASALAHAHDAGVVHRDLVPSNVFLARDMRGDVVPTLLDFGLSKAPGDDPPSLAHAGLAAGTVVYMSPERTLGVEKATAESDQYSFSAILYETLTGVPPFGAESIGVLLDRIRSATIPSPSEVSPRVPAALGNAVLRALRRDPAARFESMRALGAALLPFADAATARATERDFVGPASVSPRVSARPSRARDDAPVRVESPPPPLPCPAGTSPFRIKGLAYRGFLHMVNRTLPGGLGAFCDALEDPSLRPFLTQPFLATARYDVLPFVPLFATFARLVGREFAEVVAAATRAQCRYDARTVYRMIFSGDRVEDIAERLSRFCTQYYDFGRYHGSVPQEGRLVLLYEEIPEYLMTWYSPMHLTYTRETARVIGAGELRMLVETKTPAGKRGDFPLVSIRSELAWGE
jgi:serine/threonine-protein kinase